MHHANVTQCTHWTPLTTTTMILLKVQWTEIRTLRRDSIPDLLSSACSVGPVRPWVPDQRTQGTSSCCGPRRNPVPCPARDWSLERKVTSQNYEMPFSLSRSIQYPRAVPILLIADYSDTAYSRLLNQLIPIMEPIPIVKPIICRLPIICSLPIMAIICSLPIMPIQRIADYWTSWYQLWSRYRLWSRLFRYLFSSYVVYRLSQPWTTIYVRTSTLYAYC